MAKIEITIKKVITIDMKVRYFFVADEEHLEFVKELITKGGKDKNLEVEFNQEPL